MDQIPPTQRQSLSYIKGLLQSRRLIPKNKMGQNFLIDLNLVDLVARTGELTKEDCVLEVGTGTGGLTARMAYDAGGVFTVELDPDFFNLARGILLHQPNVRQLHGDCLAGKNELNPDMIEGWVKMRDDLKLTKMKLVANLPYAIATPLIANLIISGLPIERFVAMVQLEVAQRMIALPDTKDYNSLAVLVQSVGTAEIVRTIAPTNFWPQPAVDSAVVMIKPDPAKLAKLPSLKRWRAFLRDLYTHRRKNMRAAIAGWPSGRKDKKIIDAKLDELGFEGSVRAETLSIDDHLKLFHGFESYLFDEK